jgi:8-oxo-dGTP pyrophosphatase MutT (NUDIX family)
MSDSRIYYQDMYWNVTGNDTRVTSVATPNTAQCVPLTDSGFVIFILEPSPAYDQRVLTLPGGLIEADEPPHVAANRELQEEIGYFANQLDFIVTLRPYEKYIHNQTWIYLARNLTPSQLIPDEPHTIRTELVPLNGFERLINAGRLYDSSAVAALYMARILLENE